MLSDCKILYVSKGKEIVMLQNMYQKAKKPEY